MTTTTVLGQEALTGGQVIIDGDMSGDLEVLLHKPRDSAMTIQIKSASDTREGNWQLLPTANGDDYGVAATFYEVGSLVTESAVTASAAHETLIEVAKERTPRLWKLKYTDTTSGTGAGTANVWVD